MWMVRIPKDIEGMDILIYGYLQGRYNAAFSSSCFIDTDLVCEELSLKNPGGVGQQVNDLLSDGVISGEVLEKKNTFRIEISSVNPKSSFVMLPWECLLKIVNSGHKYKYRLLTFYRNLFAFKSNNSNIVSKIPLSAFPTLFGIGVQTGVRYIKFLEDLGVLVVNHSRPNSGYTNTYSLPDEPLDKFQIKEYYNDKDTTNA